MFDLLFLGRFLEKRRKDRFLTFFDKYPVAYRQFLSLFVLRSDWRGIACFGRSSALGFYLVRMNFLAHLYLSASDDKLTVGNFLADFIRNKDLPALPPRIRAGVVLHRKIDRFTDNHPLVRQGTERLRPHHHKYAPVILDVLYDYILANNWPDWSEEPLFEFTHRIYRVLKQHIALMPPLVQRRLPLMIADDWLAGYGMESGLRYTFERMKKRTSFPHYLDHAVDHFFEDYDAYLAEFNAFFPEVIRYVQAQMDAEPETI
ncbi:MAG: DUF479 domain-containing protein [Bacteroidetes bacterium]|nr:MAG: DUF479 domain-containing protein [Bacteroidota bacterium]